MKKTILFLLLISSFLFSDTTQKKILIVNSYHKGYKWSDDIIKSIENIFYKHTNFDVSVLYMDSKRITSSEYSENLKSLYKVQLRHRNYDLVISVDRFAYDFVLDSYNELFINSKVLTVGIENFSKERLIKKNLENKVWTLIEKRDLKGNLKLIERIIPSIKNLYIVNDKSLNALHTEPLIKELYKDFTGRYNLIYIKEDDLDSLKDKFASFQKDSAILFIRFYKNSDGKLNKNYEIAKFIKNSKIPVFITDSIFKYDGAIGGKIVDLEDFGTKSALIALDILNNKEVKSINIFDDFKYVFDSKKLDEFTIAIAQVSKDYELVNKRLTFFDKHRGFINFVFIISPILLLLILGLIHNIYMRIKTQNSLKQRIDFDEVLLNAIESPIFWEDEKGKILDSNMMFCNIINIEKSRVINKRLDEFLDNKNVKVLRKALQKYQKNSKKYSSFKLNVSSTDEKIYFIKQTTYCDSKTKKTGTVTILTDITKEKKIELERQKNQQFIIQQSKLAEIGEIFSSIAHQWKSPLVEITTIAQESFYLNKSNKNEDESYVKDIMTQVEYMNKTINDFQNFMVPSNKKTRFCVSEAIEELLKIVSHNIKYNYIKLDLQYDKEQNLEVLGYKNEFMQAVLNIINNAKDELIKKDFNDRELKIKILHAQEKVKIEILDNAGGIKKANLKKIFKAYFSTKKEGHGIGLYMAKMIIEDKMNGKLSAKNIKNKAMFEIILECVN
ncbi:ATP-binding protein [Arcobacter sp. YIC-464]|uniref:sensor histidine kinase n=1 Tax=Arcobacter sp. YIC-464 TaxID=3376631 RepID=UPI003C1DECAC